MPSPSGDDRQASAADRDLALLAGVQRRSRRDFTELYRLYQPRLLGYLRRLVGDPALADELVDDVMFVVWQDAAKFRGTAAVSSWIFGIAYRKTMSAIRREKRYNAPIDRLADLEHIAVRGGGDNDLLRSGLAGLSPDHRQVVELTYFCGFSYEEIAEIANCPVGTVKTRMFHARRRLRSLLPKLAGENGDRGRDHG